MHITTHLVVDAFVPRPTRSLVQGSIMSTRCGRIDHGRRSIWRSTTTTTSAAALVLAASSSGSKNDHDDTTMSIVSDEDLFHAMERLEAIDAKLGVGCGATKERARLQRVLDAWEEQQQTMEQQQEQEGEEEDYGNDDSTNDDHDEEWNDWDMTHKWVKKHNPNDRVAIFGGDPAKRRTLLEKKLAPFQCLDQFGTPRDVGLGDGTKLLNKISSHSYDVVYVWTRFNCHSSRTLIRDACSNTGTTRFEEVESLAYIR